MLTDPNSLQGTMLACERDLLDSIMGFTSTMLNTKTLPRILGFVTSSPVETAAGCGFAEEELNIPFTNVLVDRFSCTGEHARKIFRKR